MAGTYVDNHSKKYATTKWVWWTERDSIAIAKYDPNSEKFSKLILSLPSYPQLTNDQALEISECVN